MAIYSLNVSSIGKTTNAAGTASAHIRYITRESAQADITSSHLPEAPRSAQKWFDEFEKHSRKNARVADKIRIALPRELTPDQRQEVLENYMHDITANRLPWYAAIHQKGDDKHNPHVHVIIHDRDFETEKRHLRLSDSKRDRSKAGLPINGVTHLRERWEIQCNAALEKYGHDARIDKRTLEEQGIDRTPTIHIGAKAKSIEVNVGRPESKPVIDGRGRVIDYPVIDEGKTRMEHNADIIDFNLEKAARSSDSSTAIQAKFQREQRRKDAELERKLIIKRRRRTVNFRNTKKAHNSRARAVIQRRNDIYKKRMDAFTEEFKAKRNQLKENQQTQRSELKKHQSRLFNRVVATVDITGRTKQAQAEARKDLIEQHRTERAALTNHFKNVRTQTIQKLRDEFKRPLDEINKQKFAELESLVKYYQKEAANDDTERQRREAERAKETEQLERALRMMQKAKRQNQDRQFTL